MDSKRSTEKSTKQQILPWAIEKLKDGLQNPFHIENDAEPLVRWIQNGQKIAIRNKDRFIDHYNIADRLQKPKNEYKDSYKAAFTTFTHNLNDWDFKYRTQKNEEVYIWHKEGLFKQNTRDEWCKIKYMKRKYTDNVVDEIKKDLTEQLTTDFMSEISKKEEVIAEKDGVIAKKDVVIAEKDAEIMAKDEIIISLRQQIQNQPREKVVNYTPLNKQESEFLNKTIDELEVMLTENHSDSIMRPLEKVTRVGETAISRCASEDEGEGDLKSYVRNSHKKPRLAIRKTEDLINKK